MLVVLGFKQHVPFQSLDRFANDRMGDSGKAFESLRKVVSHFLSLEEVLYDWIDR